MPESPLPDEMTLQRSSRAPATVQARLEGWLGDVLPSGAGPQVTLHDGVDANGMSSETIVLDVDWTHDGEPQRGEYVARVAPAADDVPVFPEYRLGDQYHAMRLARELSEVPVPRVRWLDASGEALGTPLFFMDRVEGDVPPDVLPYTFGDNWFFDAGAERQRLLQRNTVQVLTQLHGIPDAAARFDFLDPAVAGHHGDSLLERNLARTRAWYRFGAEGLGRSELVERGFAWLQAHLPPADQHGDPVLVWGDARPGNTMYVDFAPVAVLDWEMASLGPREMDLGWMVFAHRVFQEIATMMGLPGMPDFMVADDVRTTYAELSGIEVGDLTWYQVHAAIQWCCVFLRTSVRQVHFGEIEQPDEVESVFHHRTLLERMLTEVGA